jgi:hypothetical protein
MAESVRRSVSSNGPTAAKAKPKLPAPTGNPASVVPRNGAGDVRTFHNETAALRDLTRLYSKALEGHRAKDHLLAVAAHELRHPGMHRRSNAGETFTTGWQRSSASNRQEHEIGLRFAATILFCPAPRGLDIS